MANDLISRKKLIAEYDRVHFGPPGGARKLMEDAPAVDAVEVVHGYWEKIEDDYFDLVNLKCSVCGEEWCFEDYDDCLPKNYHYCPNCGAQMDGDGNG